MVHERLETNSWNEPDIWRQGCWHDGAPTGHDIRHGGRAVAPIQLAAQAGTPLSGLACHIVWAACDDDGNHA